MIPVTSCAAFELRTSRRFTRLVAALHVLAGGVMVVGPFPDWSLLLLPLVGWSFWLHRRASSSVHWLDHAQGRWSLRSGSGEPSALRWLPATRVGEHLTVLHARAAGRRYFWAIDRTVMAEDQFRRLRVLVGISRYD